MFCKNCGNEVDEKAVLCPKCGVSMAEKKKKKPIFKRWWFWVIAVVVVIAIASSSSGDESTPASAGSSNSSSEIKTTENAGNSNASSEVKNPESNEIIYEKLDLQTLLDELDKNALKAEKTYQNKYVEVVGKISNFDSDGSYITIEPVDADEWNFDTVMCYIKNDDQLNYLLEKEVGDEVTVQGKITSIGEVLGYSIKMDNVQ